MATNRCGIRASAADVLAVLEQADAYPRWVVGPRRTVATDAGWPAPGSGFVHETGRGPLAFRDRTEVVRFDRAGGEVELEARSGPLGRALVRIRVTERGGRARVVLREQALDGPLRLLPPPARDLAIHLRNRPALRRLRRLVEADRRSARA
jgi:hypothetical protein